MRSIDVVALALVVILAVIGKLAGWGGETPEGPELRRPPPRIAAPEPIRPAPFQPGPLQPGPLQPESREALTPLPGSSRRDPAIRVEVGPAVPSTGTAFSIDGAGRWLTARHVVEGCRQVVIRTSRRKGIRVARIFTHPNADVAVLWTEGGTPPLTISGAALSTGQNGFQIGFPKGEPGDVFGRIIGRRTMRVSGQYRTHEPVIAWTQLRRVPDRGADLGGISGGPVLDRAGRVIGIVVAGAPRRGRTYSAAPASLSEAVRRAGLRIDRFAAEGPPHPRLNRRDFPSYGRDLRQKLTVAKVFCMVGGRRGRRPRI